MSQNANLRPLDGKLSREDRVLIAQDVISVLKSNQTTFVLGSRYFCHDDAEIPDTGQLRSARVKGECIVCARGMLFIKTLDRFNHFNLETDTPEEGIDSVVEKRTIRDWGEEQAELIECVFEGWGSSGAGIDIERLRSDWGYDADRKKLMISICENIIHNNGQLVISPDYIDDHSEEAAWP